MLELETALEIVVMVFAYMAYRPRSCQTEFSKLAGSHTHHQVMDSTDPSLLLACDMTELPEAQAWHVTAIALVIPSPKVLIPPP